MAFALGALAPLYLAFQDGGLDLSLRHEATAALWWGLALMLAFRFLPRGQMTTASKRALVAGGLVLAWGLASTIWTESAERSLIEVVRDLGLYGVAAAALLALNRETWAAAAAGLSAAALLVPVVAVISRLAPDLILEARFDAVFGGDRLSYPLDYWNAVASWSAMAAAAGLAWSAHVRRVAIRSVALAGVPFAIAAVYLTYSRGGLLVLGVGALAVIGLAANRVTVLIHGLTAGIAGGVGVLAVRDAPQIANGTGGEGGFLIGAALVLGAGACAAVARWTLTARIDPKKLPAALAIAGIVGLLAVIGVGVAVASQADRDSFAGSTPTGSSDPAERLATLEGARGDLWGSALSAWADEPLTGIGPGTFDFWWQRGGSDRESVRDAHSLYLETLAERGVIGLLLLLAFLALLGVAAMQGRRAARHSVDVAAATALGAVFAVFLVHAAVDWIWEATAVAALGVGAGAVAAAGASSRRERTARSLSLRVTLVIGAIVAGASAVPALVSNERVRASDAARLRADPSESLRLADDAVEAQPWAASPLAWRAVLELDRGLLEAAARDARTAIEREPTNPDHLLLAARIALARGDADALARISRVLRRLNPEYDAGVEQLEETLREGEVPEFPGAS